MNWRLRNPVLLALAPIAALGLAAMTRPHLLEQASPAPSAVAARTGPVRGLVFARPFALAESYVHHWRLEQPTVRAGWLLVLDVDPSYVEPRQSAMPVLVLGDQTVECVNFGQDSGRVVAIVPAPADERGMPRLDLAASPAWFGSPELPERVDAAWISGERARAKPGDVVLFSAAEIATARARGREPLRAADKVELHRQAAFLILEHSPRERELAEGLLVPVTR